MTNFDFLLTDPRFASFSTVAVSAENLLHIDRDSCVLNCRRAMEFAVRFVYEKEKKLKQPKSDTLVVMMSQRSFKDLVGDELWRKMDLIRKLGNNAAHSEEDITEQQAEVCLENLFSYLSFVAFRYGKGIKPPDFDRVLLELTTEEALSFVTETTSVSAESQSELRKDTQLSTVYAEAMLTDAGWKRGTDWLPPEEAKRRIGADADALLCGNDRSVLALVMIRQKDESEEKLNQRAVKGAGSAEDRTGIRPVVFMTDGFETKILEPGMKPRPCAAVYARRDLEAYYPGRAKRQSLSRVTVRKKIADRYYQKKAIKAVCRAFDKQEKKSALLVMAAGSGKTRTVIGLTDILMSRGWVGSVLFLSERETVLTQAQQAFSRYLPQLPSVNLTENPDAAPAPCVFSTCQALYDAIDTVRDEKGRVYTPGHFDLVICDEVSRAGYRRYKDLFTYFDALLVGLTASPRDEISPEIYEAFAGQNGVPTYEYDRDQALADGFLVDFCTMETELSFPGPETSYDALSDADRAEREEAFADEEEDEYPLNPALSEWLFKEDTIREVLSLLMHRGKTVDGGRMLGKTILFAQNHAHAETIVRIFREEYPALSDFAAVIDSQSRNIRQTLERFSAEGMPQIAVSSDLLAAGVDIPQVLNLVFFCSVRSKARFEQMIGRGTRPCPGLLDGKEKDSYYIFDFCGNFEFFRINKGKNVRGTQSKAGEVWELRCRLLGQYLRQKDDLQDWERMAEEQAETLSGIVKELRQDQFAVRQHLKTVLACSDPAAWLALSEEACREAAMELSPLVAAEEDGGDAVLTWDALWLRKEWDLLASQNDEENDRAIVSELQKMKDAGKIPKGGIPEVLVDQILSEGMGKIDRIALLEDIRVLLRPFWEEPISDPAGN